MATTNEPRSRTEPKVIRDEDLYPDSDGVVMGETSWHKVAVSALFYSLRNVFRGRSDVLVASDLFVYYEEMRPHLKLAPDCMVVFGVGNHHRRVFKLWEENARPAVVFEILSEGTYLYDTTHKPITYAQLGIPEYFQFDPTGECADQPLLGWRCPPGRDHDYDPIPPEPDGSLISEQLGIRLRPEGGILRVIDLRTGLPVLTDEEKAEELEEKAEELEETRGALEQTKRRAERAEVELERLRSLLKRQDSTDTNPPVA